MSLRVLVIDDEPQIRNALHRALNREGYEVLLAAGGDSAYAILSGSQVDVVILDIFMPQISGDALFLAIVRRWPELAGRIIIMSGHPDASRETWPPELRACPVLVKPFRLQDLYRAVSSVLPQPKALPLKRNGS